MKKNICQNTEIEEISRENVIGSELEYAAHSMVRANLNQVKYVMTNITTASK